MRAQVERNRGWGSEESQVGEPHSSQRPQSNVDVGTWSQPKCCRVETENHSWKGAGGSQGPASSPAQTFSALEHLSPKAHPFPREKRRRDTGTAGVGPAALNPPLCPASPTREGHTQVTHRQRKLTCLKPHICETVGKPCLKLGNAGDHGTHLWSSAPLKGNALFFLYSLGHSSLSSDSTYLPSLLQGCLLLWT